MRLRHIEIFHAVYTTGSVSAAARLLNVSQPSVTKVLQHAEQLLGFALFLRTKGRLLPTEEAHNLFAEVSGIQDRVHALRQISQNLRAGRGATLRIAALPSLGLGVIPMAVARMLARTPGVAFDLQTTHHDEMMRRLYEREADIVIGYEVPRGAPVVATPIGRGELVAFYRETDMPGAPPRLTLEALADRPFISPVQSGPTGQLLSAELQRLGVLLNEIVWARTFYIATALVRSGVGMTIVDSFTAEASAAPGLSIRPLDPPVRIEVFAITLENRPPSAQAGAFLAALTDVLRSA